MDQEELERMLLRFRNQYGEVYVTAIGDVEFVFRALTPKEHREIAEFAENEDDAFERICNTAVLWPKIDFTRGRAYWPTMLAPQILEESGFGGNYKEIQLLEIFREQLKGFDKQAEILIATAFPQYRFEEIETWTKEKLIKMAVAAEWQLRYLRGLKDFELIPTVQQEPDVDGEVQEEQPFDIMEKAWELRRRGQDPLFVLRDLIQKPKPPFVERPIIGGNQQIDTIIGGIDAWKKEVLPRGRYDIVQKQVQEVSRRRRRHVSRRKDADQH